MSKGIKCNESAEEIKRLNPEDPLFDWKNWRPGLMSSFCTQCVFMYIIIYIYTHTHCTYAPKSACDSDTHQCPFTSHSESHYLATPHCPDPAYSLLHILFPACQAVEPLCICCPSLPPPAPRPILYHRPGPSLPCLRNCALLSQWALSSCWESTNEATVSSV